MAKVMESEPLNPCFLRAFVKCPLQNGVKVLSEFPGGEGNSFETPQEGLGNGYGNGEGMDLDEQTKSLAEEFAVLLNPKTVLTPHLCRKGCKHYDSVGDQKSAEFREFFLEIKGKQNRPRFDLWKFRKQNFQFTGRGIDVLSGGSFRECFYRLNFNF